MKKFFHVQPKRKKNTAEVHGACTGYDNYREKAFRGDATGGFGGGSSDGHQCFVGFKVIQKSKIYLFFHKSTENLQIPPKQIDEFPNFFKCFYLYLKFENTLQ